MSNSAMPDWAKHCLESADESPAFAVRQAWDAVAGSIDVALKAQPSIPVVSAIDSKIEYLHGVGLLSNADAENLRKLKTEAEAGAADSERAKSLVTLAADLCERIWNGSVGPDVGMVVTPMGTNP